MIARCESSPPGARGGRRLAAAVALAVLTVVPGPIGSMIVDPGGRSALLSEGTGPFASASPSDIGPGWPAGPEVPASPPPPPELTGFSPADVRVNTETAGDQQAPSVDVGSDGAIWVAYTSPESACTADTAGTDIRVSRSTDGGASYSEVTCIGDPANWALSDPSLTVHGSGATATVLITYLNDADPQALLVSRSTDGGSSWAQATLLTTPDGINGAAVSYDATGSYAIVVVSRFIALSSHDVRAMLSTDGGATWGAEFNAASTTRSEESPSVAVTGSAAAAVAHVAYMSVVGGGDIRVHYVKSAAGMASFGASLEVAGSVTSRATTKQSVAVDGEGDPHLAWDETVSGESRNILYARSQDQGATFLATVTVAGGSADQFAPALAVAGSGDGAEEHAYLAWADTRGGTADIYFTGSDNGGASFPAASAHAVANVVTTNIQESPSIGLYAPASTSRRVSIAWADERAGPTDWDVFSSHWQLYRPTFACSKGDAGEAGTVPSFTVSFERFNLAKTANVGSNCGPVDSWADGGRNWRFPATLPGAAPCPTGEFQCRIFDDTVAQTGWEPSVASDTSGVFHVSYRDVTNTALRYAKYVGSGGSGCTPGVTEWSCATIDSTGDVGRWTSIVAGSPTNVHIAYTDSGNTALKHAWFVGSGGTNCDAGVTEWSCETIESGGASDFGRDPAITLDPGGSPQISSQDNTGTSLRWAKYVGAGGSCDSSTAWNCEMVESANNPGVKSDIEVAADGTVHIVHYESSLDDLRHCRYTGSWTCIAVDFVNVVGEEVGTDIDGAGNVHAAYSDDTLGALKYAKYDASLSSWTVTVVDDQSDIVGRQAALALDGSGNPWISYEQATQGDLRLARYVGSGGTCTSALWSCATVDTTGGKFTSLEFDDAGVPVIFHGDNNRLRSSEAAPERWRTDQPVVGTVTSGGTISLPYWRQFKQAYKVSKGDGSEVHALPAISFSCRQSGAAQGFSATTSFGRTYCDNGQSWSFTNPITVSGAERWSAPSAQASGTVSSAATRMPSYYHQFSISISKGDADDPDVLPGTPQITLTRIYHGSSLPQPFSAFGQGAFSDDGTAWSITQPLTISASERWSTSQAASGTVSAALTINYWHQYKTDWTATTAAGGDPMGPSNRAVVRWLQHGAPSSPVNLWDGASQTNIWVDHAAGHRFDGLSDASGANERWSTRDPGVRTVVTQSGSGDSYAYRAFDTTTSRTILANDFLEYDIYVAAPAGEHRCGLDAIVGGSRAKDVVAWTDQNGLAFHPATELTGYANGQWYHRRFDMSSRAGQAIGTWMIGHEGDAAGSYVCIMNNVVVTQNGQEALVIYRNGGTANFVAEATGDITSIEHYAGYKVTGPGTYSATYYDQLRNTVNAAVVSGGNALTCPANGIDYGWTAYAQAQSRRVCANTGVWSDRSSTLTITDPSSGSGSSERWSCVGGTVPITVASGGNLYPNGCPAWYHQLEITWDVSIGAGGSSPAGSDTIQGFRRQFGSDSATGTTYTADLVAYNDRGAEVDLTEVAGTLDDVTRYNFNQHQHGMNATGASIVPVSGVLSVSSSGTNPEVYTPSGPPMSISASAYAHVSWRMECASAATSARVWFLTSTDSVFDSVKSKSVPIACGGATYRVYDAWMGDVASWTGTITRVRLDPGGGGATAGDVFNIDWIAITGDERWIEQTSAQDSGAKWRFAPATPVSPSAVYWNQLFTRVNIVLAAGGNPMPDTVCVGYQYAGSGRSTCGLTDGSVAKIWHDRGVGITTTFLVPGSTSSERWRAYYGNLGSPVSGGTTLVEFYQNQLSITTAATTAAGGVAMTGANCVPVTVTSFGSPSGGGCVFDGAPTTNWVDRTGAFSFANPSSGSTATERWQTAASTAYTASAPTTYTLTYYHQYRPTMYLFGTKSTATVAGTARTLFGASSPGGPFYGRWSDWADRSTALALADVTDTGCGTTDTVSTSSLTSAFTAAANYCSTPIDFQRGGSFTNNLRPEFIFYYVDLEGDRVRYHIEVDDNSDFTSTIVSADSGISMTGFSDLTIPAEVSPFPSGDQIQYTMQSDLASGTTYYWRLRVFPVGDAGFTPFDPRSHTVDPSITNHRWQQTTQSQFQKDTVTGGMQITSTGGGAVEPPLVSAGGAGSGGTPGTWFCSGCTVMDPCNTVTVAGTISSWSVSLQSATTLKLKLFRPSGSNFLFIGETGLVSSPGAGVFTFSASLPAQVGDKIATYSTSGGVNAVSGCGHTYQFADITTNTAQSAWSNAGSWNIMVTVYIATGSGTITGPPIEFVEGPTARNSWREAAWTNTGGGTFSVSVEKWSAGSWTATGVSGSSSPLSLGTLGTEGRIRLVGSLSGSAVITDWTVSWSVVPSNDGLIVRHAGVNLADGGRLHAGHDQEEFVVTVTDQDGADDIQYVDLRLDGTTNYVARWIRSSDSFTESAGGAFFEILSTGADTAPSGNSWTIAFRIKFGWDLPWGEAAVDPAVATFDSDGPLVTSHPASSYWVENDLALRETGLRGHWRFDEGSGTNAGDSSGLGNSATLSCCPPVWVEGKVGGALSFDGIDDSVSPPNPLSPAIPSQVSVSAWARPNSFNAGGGNDPMVFYQGVSGEIAIGFRSVTGRPFAQVKMNDAVWYLADSGSGASLGTWYHLALVFNGVDVRLYVDGSLVTTTAVAGSALFSIGFPPGIGRYTGSSSGFFNGVIDEVRYYERALDAGEVADLAQRENSDGRSGLVAEYPLDEGAGTTTYDTSGSGSPGTSGAAINWESGKYGYARGPSNPFTVTGLKVNTAAGAWNTVSFWMHFTGTPSGMPFGWGSAYDLWFSNDCFGFSTFSSDILGIVGTASLAGAWHHITAVFYNGVPTASTVALYIDGVSHVLALCPNEPGAPDSRFVSDTAEIGGSAFSGSYDFSGRVDEVRVWNRPLGADEVARHAGLPTAYRDAGLELDFRMEQFSGTTVVDSSGFNRNASIAGTAAWQFGRRGGALGFDGSTTEVNTGYNPSEGTSWTVETWAYATNLASEHMIAGTSVNGIGPGDWDGFWVETSGTGLRSCIDDGPTINCNSGSEALLTNTWYHLAFVRSGTSLKYYVNGAQTSSFTLTAGSTGPVSTTMYLGRIGPGNTCCRWAGALDEFKFLLRALSPAEVAEHAALVSYDREAGKLLDIRLDEGTGPAAYDSSGNGLTGTLVNGPTRTFGQEGRALSFNGANQYVALGTGTLFNGATAGSVEAWINPGAGYQSDYRAIYYESNFASSNNLILQLLGGSGEIRFYHGVTCDTSGQAPASNTWTHIVGTFDGTNDRIYKNGVLVKTCPNTNPVSDVGIEKNIGRYEGDSQYFLGAIDGVRVWSRTLSATEVGARYSTQPRTVQESGLRAVSAIRGSLMSDRSYVGPGESITWSGVTAYYEGTAVTPPDSEFDLEIQENPATTWTQSTGASLNLGTTAPSGHDEWDVHNLRIANVPGGGPHGRRSFLMRIDATAPPATTAAANGASPSPWTDVDSFTITAVKPLDLTEVATAWYKIDSVPTSPGDGTRASTVPFTVSVGTSGVHPLYLWPEDGVGNKDHNNRAQVDLRLDQVPIAFPTFEIFEDGAWRPLTYWHNTNQSPPMRVTMTADLSGLDTTSAVMEYSTNGGGSWVPTAVTLHTCPSLSGCPAGSGATGTLYARSGGVPFLQDSATQNLVKIRANKISGQSAQSADQIVKIDTSGSGFVVNTAVYSHSANPPAAQWVDVDFTDTVSGLSKLDVRFEGGGGQTPWYTVIASMGGAASYTQNFNLWTWAPVGTSTVRLRLTDVAGNTAENAAVSYTVIGESQALSLRLGTNFIAMAGTFTTPWGNVTMIQLAKEIYNQTLRVPTRVAVFESGAWVEATSVDGLTYFGALGDRTINDGMGVMVKMSGSGSWPVTFSRASRAITAPVNVNFGNGIFFISVPEWTGGGTRTASQLGDAMSQDAGGGCYSDITYTRCVYSILKWSPSLNRYMEVLYGGEFGWTWTDSDFVVYGNEGFLVKSTGTAGSPVFSP